MRLYVQIYVTFNIVSNNNDVVNLKLLWRQQMK